VSARYAGGALIRAIAGTLLLIAVVVPAHAQDVLPTSIRIGTSGDYAPFSIAEAAVPGSRPAPAGFDVAVAERFASEAGLRIEWVFFRWPDLAADLAAERFDVAMSGVTWTPSRATQGYSTRAVAATGPCWLGAETPKRVAVNRGGALERFARRHFAGAEITTVENNRTLPDLLARGETDAIVTDRFEKRFFQARAWPEHCEPASERKVYWVAPARAHDLGPRLDDWLARNEAQVDVLRARWLGGSAPRTELDNVVDLAARRLALMPAVARAKRGSGTALVDPAREAQVLEAVRARAAKANLDPASVEALFRLQIEVGTRVQARAGDALLSEAPDLDLAGALRPAIGALGDRIVASLADAVPIDPKSLAAVDLTPLTPWLEPDEREALRTAIGAVRGAR
jgi:cyclohexadienyl dehydratase